MLLTVASNIDAISAFASSHVIFLRFLADLFVDPWLTRPIKFGFSFTQIQGTLRLGGKIWQKNFPVVLSRP